MGKRQWGRKAGRAGKVLAGEKAGKEIKAVKSEKLEVRSKGSEESIALVYHRSYQLRAIH
jgi:hypothetical protein